MVTHAGCHAPPIVEGQEILIISGLAALSRGHFLCFFVRPGAVKWHLNAPRGAAGVKSSGPEALRTGWQNAVEAPGLDFVHGSAPGLNFLVSGLLLTPVSSFGRRFTSGLVYRPVPGPDFFGLVRGFLLEFHGLDFQLLGLASNLVFIVVGQKVEENIHGIEHQVNYSMDQDLGSLIVVVVIITIITVITVIMVITILIISSVPLPVASGCAGFTSL